MVKALVVALFLAAMLVSTAAAGSCDVPDSSKQDCGYDGINQIQCEAKGCCWDPINPNPSNFPWCFYAAGPTTPSPSPVPVPTGPPFNASVVALMTSYLKSNLNWRGLGAVIAAPSDNGLGGSYRYSWMRDAALTMRAWYRYSGEASPALSEAMDGYIQWVIAAQANANPDVNGIDPRGDPKWDIENATAPGELYTGGWCRPQTGSPALRATTLMEYASDLLKAGNASVVSKYLWTGSNSSFHGGAIYYDLMYVKDNLSSQQPGCDIWENIMSDHNFWITYVSYTALVIGAEFATTMGDTTTAAMLTEAAAPFVAALPSFWNGQYLIGMDDRQLDSSVILAINNAYMGTPAEADFSFSAPWVVATFAAHTALAKSMFPVNAVDTANGVPGLLYGRFEGDDYGPDGAGAWILVTAGFAENLYRGAAEILVGGQPPAESIRHYASVLATPEAALQSMDAATLAVTLASEGDGLLDRVHYHVASSQFHLSEQLDPKTGVECSAKNLSWSYANVLKAMHYREAFRAAYAAATGDADADF